MKQETKQIETIEEFAQDYISRFVNLEKPQPSRMTYAMINAARWQKEQDKAIIEELLKALKILRDAAIHCDPFFENRWSIASEITNKAIQSAQKHIKTN